MIIKATRIATTSGAGAVAAHVLRGEKNERIELLQGSEAEMHAAARDAEAAGAKYALRHYKIAPQSEMTSEEARDILRELGREFGFDPERATLIEHQKPRAGGKGFDRHWHAIVPEVDAITGRVLDSHWMRPRHEKIARIAEARLGHEVVPGRFNSAVQRHLEAEGRHDVAERIQGATEVPRPREGYATNIHQMHNRKGNDLPADRLAIREAWERSDNAQAFRAALAEQGIRIEEGEKEGVYVAYRDQDFLGAIHRLAGVPKIEAAARLQDAPALEQPAPSPETPAPQPEPPTPPGGGEHVPAPAEAATATTAPQDAPAPAAPAAQGEAPPQPAAATATPAAPAPRPSGGGGGGGGASAPAAAEAPKPGASDLFSSEDPTAGIEPPKVGDLAGELRYREAVMKKAAEIAERKARQKAPAPQQQGGKNGNSQTGGGGGGGGDKSAAALAAAAHEALLELIERGRKARTQAEFDHALEAYIAAAAQRRDEARRGTAPEGRAGTGQAAIESSPRDGHFGGHERPQGQREPDAVAGSGRDAGEPHGGASEDRERAARNAAALGRRFEAARVTTGFEGVDLTRARAAHEAMKNGPRPDPLEGLGWEEAKAKKDAYRRELWDQFRDDGKVLADFARMDRDEARRAEIEAAEPIRARMRERWHDLSPAKMKRAREIIKATIKEAGDAVRAEQKARPKRDFDDYVRGLASCFGDERAAFVVRFDERTAERKAALFRPIEEALEAIVEERAKAPRPRDPEAEGKTARRALWTPYEAAQEKLKEAREAFEAMEKPKGWRIFNAAAYEAYDAARERVADAHAACEAVKPTPSKLDDAEHKTRVNAQAGHAQYQRWQQAHGHKLDQREHALTNIRDAMQGGDKQMIRAMRSGGLDAALELQRKRDEEERRAREAALRAANVVQMRQQNRQGMEMPAPRMR